jgi:hypothetical protein
MGMGLRLGLRLGLLLMLRQRLRLVLGSRRSLRRGWERAWRRLRLRLGSRRSLRRGWERAWRRLLLLLLLVVVVVIIVAGKRRMSSEIGHAYSLSQGEGRLVCAIQGINFNRVTRTGLSDAITVDLSAIFQGERESAVHRHSRFILIARLRSIPLCTRMPHLLLADHLK